MSEKVILISGDGERFEVEKAVAVQSKMINNSLEDVCDGESVPLPNVKSNTMPKLIEYLKKHAEVVPEELMKRWDSEFIDVDQALLLEILLAADYLAIDNLLDLACQRAADMMKGKTPEQIRETFNIVCDFTPEQEEQIRKQNSWAFE